MFGRIWTLYFSSHFASFEQNDAKTLIRPKKLYFSLSKQFVIYLRNISINNHRCYCLHVQVLGRIKNLCCVLLIRHRVNGVHFSYRIAQQIRYNTSPVLSKQGLKGFI